MSPRLLLPLSLLLVAALSAQTTPPAAKDEPVKLDKIDVTADKQNNFSLPLDAAPASASPSATSPPASPSSPRR